MKYNDCREFMEYIDCKIHLWLCVLQYALGCYMHTHTAFDMFEEIMQTICCVLMLCVLSCQVAFELCSSLNLWPNSKSILLLLTCY